MTAPLTVTVNGNRIELRGPYNEAMKSFYASLPGASWSKTANCWKCDITPACCWRITSTAPVEVHADEQIRKLGHKFYDPILHPGEIVQPPIQIGQAWKHQAAAYSFAVKRASVLLDMWMATGKSRVAVNLADNWGVQNLLILCPVAVMGVWRRELAKHSPRQWMVSVVEKKLGSAAKKAEWIRKQSAMAEARGMANAIVINYESVWRPPVDGVILNMRWDLIIGDELHRIKGHGSSVSKYCAQLHLCSTRRIGLTGTPMAHSPLDLFGQFRFLDRGIYGSSYHQFRSQFAVSGHFGADHIVGFKNQDELARRMSLITFSVGKEVLDLPPVQHIEIPITLGVKSKKVYDELEEESIVQVQEGRITASNGLVKLLRLAQMTSGFCMVDDDPGIVNRITEVGTEKREALEDLLEALNEPVVVACRFTHDLLVVKQVAESLKRRHGEVSGARKDLTPNATMPEDIDVMGVQVASGGVGIDLQRARIIILYNATWSLGDYEQLLARVHRPGQTRDVVYYHLVATGTVDEVVYQSLTKKREVIDDVLGYLKGRAEHEC